MPWPEPMVPHVHFPAVSFVLSVAFHAMCPSLLRQMVSLRPVNLSKAIVREGGSPCHCQPWLASEWLKAASEQAEETCRVYSPGMACTSSRGKASSSSSSYSSSYSSSRVCGGGAQHDTAVATPTDEDAA